MLPGHDRRRAVALAFALCLAVGSATVGRDGPEATAPVEPPEMLSFSRDTSDVVLFAFPDRLANEPLMNLPFVPVRVRATEGLAVNMASPGQSWVVTWTERGTAYWLSSDRRDLSDLLRLAGSLR